MTIANLLKTRNARLLPPINQTIPHEEWLKTARYLAENYPLFDILRRDLNQYSQGAAPTTRAQHEMLKLLESRGFVETRDNKRYYLANDNEARRFITGAWLEMLAHAALMQAGADEAVHGQRLQWKVGPYQGRNEIDVIARKRQRLILVSCKAIGARMNGQQTQLMRHLDQTDNLADHFGRKGDKAVLLVTTDLWDEARQNKARYPALHGKAKVLDVHLVTLEDLEWNRLVARFRTIMRY